MKQKLKTPPTLQGIGQPAQSKGVIKNIVSPKCPIRACYLCGGSGIEPDVKARQLPPYHKYRGIKTKMQIKNKLFFIFRNKITIFV